MSSLTRRLQTGCRAALRPVVARARRWLTPPPEPVQFHWHQITAGPASGTTAILPAGKEITAAICEGRYEPDVMNILAALVEPESVCFDIGGHYGCITYSLARLAPRGQVHTFEPVPSHADRIRQSAEKSGYDHVTVHESAVAGRTGEMSLRFAKAADADDSMAYLDEYGGVDTAAAREHYARFERITVRTTTLDALTASLPMPDLIKIDAEGAEAPILAGGRQLIAQARPRLLIEMHGITEALECAELLQSLDYRAILLTDQKITMPILWTHRSDETALNKVGDALGRQPQVLFDAKPPRP